MKIDSKKENEMRKVKVKTINFQNHRIYYEVRGTSIKALIFIHGWTSCIQSWKYQLDSFKDYRVIAIDLPGNGKSSMNENVEYTMELFADSVNAVLKEERVKKAFFIGHSMGFSVSEVLAIKYPKLCVGICSVDGVHFELPEDQKGKDEWIKYNREFAKSLETEKGREDFINTLFLPNTSKKLKEEIFEMSRTVPLKIGKSMIEGAEKDQKFWIKKIVDIPCLAIYSPVFQLSEEYKKDFKKMYPQVEYHEINDVSHFLMLEIPNKVNQIIFEYLEKTYIT